MRRILRSSTVLLWIGSAASAQHLHVIRQTRIAWRPAPDSLPTDARFAAIAGDPAKPGPFTVRIKVPAGYAVMPHAVWTTDSPAVIQVDGTDPFTISYVRPQDDPRNATPR